MGNSIPTQLRFPAIAGFTVRADFEGGALSSDFGAHLLPALCQRKPLHGASEQQHSTVVKQQSDSPASYITLNYVLRPPGSSAARAHIIGHYAKCRSGQG